MNVIMIYCDQYNADFIGLTGKTLVETPTIDRLARDGVMFSNTYCQSPLCGPSRTAMLTGHYSHELGTWGNAFPYKGETWFSHLSEQQVPHVVIGKMDTEEHAASEKPGENIGVNDWRYPWERSDYDHADEYRYHLMLAPKNHLVNQMKNTRPRDPSQPFKEVRNTREAISWLTDERPGDRSWFMQLNFHAPHPAWRPHPDIFEKYLAKIDTLPEKYTCDINLLHPYDRMRSIFSGGIEQDRELLHRVYAAYCATCEEIDNSLAKVLSTLEEIGEKDNTLVIFTSDHGEMVGAHGIFGKCSMRDDSVRVPLIMRGPGLPAGRRTGDLVSLFDIYPTASDALDMTACKPPRGSSLLPLARGDTDEGPNEYIFSEFHSNGSPEGVYMIREGRWKLIEFVTWPSMLFDLDNDPDEMCDLLDEENSPGSQVFEVAEKLRKSLYRVCDPLKVDRRAKRELQRRFRRLYREGRISLEDFLKRCYPEPLNLS